MPLLRGSGFGIWQALNTWGSRNRIRREVSRLPVNADVA